MFIVFITGWQLKRTCVFEFPFQSSSCKREAREKITRKCLNPIQTGRQSKSGCRSNVTLDGHGLPIPNCSQINFWKSHQVHVWWLSILDAFRARWEDVSLKYLRWSIPPNTCRWLLLYVTLNGKTGINVLTRSQHTSTLKQKKLVLARLKCVQKHTSLARPFVSWGHARNNNAWAVEQWSVFRFENKSYSACNAPSVSFETRHLVTLSVGTDTTHIAFILTYSAPA